MLLVCKDELCTLLFFTVYDISILHAYSSLFKLAVTIYFVFQSLSASYKIVIIFLLICTFIYRQHHWFINVTLIPIIFLNHIKGFPTSSHLGGTVPLLQECNRETPQLVGYTFERGYAACCPGPFLFAVPGGLYEVVWTCIHVNSLIVSGLDNCWCSDTLEHCKTAKWSHKFFSVIVMENKVFANYVVCVFFQVTSYCFHFFHFRYKGCRIAYPADICNSCYLF